MDEALVYDLDPETCRRRAAEYKTAVKAALMERLTPAVAGSVVSAASCYPMVVDLGVLSVLRCGGLERATPETRSWLFFDESPATEVELGDGLLPSIRRVGAQPGEIFSTEELADIYSAQVGPTELQRSSREAYWTMWRQVLTFGMAHGTMDRLLPMPPQEVRALLMEFMMLGVSAGSLKNVLSAVIHRHRMAGLTPPLVAPGAFKRTMKAVASVTGMPSRLRYPIGTHHLREILRLCGINGERGPSLVEHTAMVTTCTGDLHVLQQAGGTVEHADVLHEVEPPRGVLYGPRQGAGGADLQAQAGYGPVRAVRQDRAWTLGGAASRTYSKVGLAYGPALHKGGETGGEMPVLRPGVSSAAGGAQHRGVAAGGRKASGPNVETADIGTGEDCAGVDRGRCAALFRNQHAPRRNHGGSTGQSVGADPVLAERTWNGNDGAPVCGPGGPAHPLRDESGNTGRRLRGSMGRKAVT